MRKKNTPQRFGCTTSYQGTWSSETIASGLSRHVSFELYGGEEGTPPLWSGCLSPPTLIPTPSSQNPKSKKTIIGGCSSNGAWNRCKNRSASALWLNINVAPFTNHKQPLGAERTPWLTVAPTWRTNDLEEPTAAFGSTSRLGIWMMESICQAVEGSQTLWAPNSITYHIVLLSHFLALPLAEAVVPSESS